MNKIFKNDKIVRYTYIVRRALWFGSVKNADVQNAFNINQTQSSALLSEAADKYKAFLQRDKKQVSRKKAEWPRPYPTIINDRTSTDVDASATFILLSVQNDLPYEAELGFDPTQFVTRQNLVNEMLPPEEVLRSLLSALFNGSVLEMQYVGLKKKENATWRQIIPLQFEFLDGHWRLHARDVSGSEELATDKWFLLSRVLGARAVVGAVSEKFKYKANRYANQMVQLRVTLNSDLTPDQQTVVSRQLGLKDNCLWLRRKDIFDFKRRYVESDLDVQKDIVWPLITAVEELN